jgi:spermidine dehydrogenase
VVTRRDFLNGIALSTAAAYVAPRDLLGLPADAAEAPYPPALTGLRGSTDRAYAAAHLLRDGLFWERAGTPRDTGEAYDLVVVGGGVSGLAAAHYFREASGPRARVLVLDNHDDFGGHARRNEFTQAGRTVLGYGGSFSIESPAPYSAVAQRLVRRLGVDVARWPRAVDAGLYARLGLRAGVFFDRETFGADRLLPTPPMTDLESEAAETAPAPPDAWQTFLAAAPLQEAAKRDLLRLHTERVDYLPGLGSAQKKARLARMSYADFLTGPARCDRQVVAFYQARPHSLYGVGIDAVPAQDAWGLGFPGFAGMGLSPAAGRGMNRDAVPSDAPEYFFHFPDGNATLARLLMRALVPACLPAGSAEELVGARCDYGTLDAAGAPVRVRLDSTAVKVAHRGTDAAREVEVTYARGTALETVRARRCILACWHAVIPYICPELPEAQKDALAYAIKVPIVYTNVLLRSWHAFVKAGVSRVYAPGGFHTALNLDLPVSVGSYRCARTPDEPILVHLLRTPCSPGQPARQQHRAGRVELLATPFAEFERRIHDELGRVLGPSGLDPARDVLAITVNRWAHGYAYQYNSLWDPFWRDGGEQPCTVARRRHGLISIANSDAGAYAYLDGAIDQGYRAAREATA